MVFPETSDDGKRKTYSKRERKPTKRYELEDTDYMEDAPLNKEDNKSTNVTDRRPQQKTGPGSGRKRGRPPKLVTGEFSPILTSEDVQTTKEAIPLGNPEAQGQGTGKLHEKALTPENTAKRKRGRPRKSDIDKSLNEDPDSFPGEPDRSVGKNQKSRSKKVEGYNRSLSKIDKGEVEDDSLIEEHTDKMPGRKKRRIDYSMLNDGEDTETDTTSDLRKRKSDQGLKVLDVTTPEKSPRKPASAKRKKPKKDLEFNCPKCDRVFPDKQAIQRHAAVEHQIWWTPEHLEGEVDKSALRKVIKIKNYLNCPKCDKRINFLHYYLHHVEWCGRENETYTCEVCGHGNLKAIWKSQHHLTCVGVVRKVAEERSLEEESDDEIEDNNQLEDTEGTRQRKREAAKKAMSVVKKITQNMNDVLLGGDDDDKDPDAKLEDDDDEEDDDDNIDDDLDEEDKEESSEAGEESDEEVGVKRNGRASQGRRQEGEFTKYFNTYPLMLKWMEKNYSRKVFTGLLPKKRDWNLLDNSEGDRYLPKRLNSVKFTLSEGGDPDGLKLFECRKFNDVSVLFVGLCVWKVAWCSMPVKCADDQYLAVIGRTDPSDKFLTINYRGPGVIQIWNMSSLTAKMPDNSIPQLWYMIAHEFGLATQIKWCPSGCYKSNTDQIDSETYPRLGLLAACFTDGSVRIFSLPILPPPESSQEVRIYKPNAALSLYPSCRIDNIKISCSCLDWIQVNTHEKILAGYSDGSVRVFNLQTRNPPLFFRSDKKHGDCLLPFQSFHAHRKMVRAVSWLYRYEDIVITACENFDTYVWDLSDIEFPIFQDTPVNMLTSVASSLFHPGIFAGSDDNYALNTNRARYFEISNIHYSTVTKLRKDETVEFNLSSQSACIWEVSFSDWLSYLLSCDNRGNIHGMPMGDSIEKQLGVKDYRYRQLLLTIEEDHTKVKNKTEEPEDKGSVCDCNQASCIKCSAIQKTANNEFCNGPPHSVLQTIGQTEHAVEGMKNSTEKPSKRSQSDARIPIRNNPDKSMCLSTDSSGVHLKFNDHFEAPLTGLDDTEQDQYNTMSDKALKTVAINPNHLHCTWITFGGDSGLIGLANIHKVLPKKAQTHLEKKILNIS